jgi:mono/diheme cytochrome c family protein
MKNDINTQSHQTSGTFRLALLLGAGLALAGLTGCGQNSDASATASNLNTAPEQTPAVEPAAAPAAPSAANGQQLFATACAGCHGAQGQGVPHLGKDLQTSQFVAGLDDAKLAGFIAQGRGASDPLNTTHIAMPPKGGNPALSSQNIADIVAYIRQLQKQPPLAAQ